MNMKYLVILTDGMADYPIEELSGQTPLQYARTPFMDQLDNRQGGDHTGRIPTGQ